MVVRFWKTLSGLFALLDMGPHPAPSNLYSKVENMENKHVYMTRSIGS